MGKSLGEHSARKSKALFICLKQKEKKHLWGHLNLYSSISKEIKERNSKLSFKIICESPFVLRFRSAGEHKLISPAFLH